jgi:hypothetical protein
LIRLATRIQERGGSALLILYPGLDHISIILAFAVARFEIAPVLRDVVRFLRDTGARR